MSETLREGALVEALEAHQWYPGFGSCRCGWIDPVTPEGSCGTEDRHRAHLVRALLAATAPTPDHDPLNTRCDHNINRLHVALPCTCAAPTPDEPTLRACRANRRCDRCTAEESGLGSSALCICGPNVPCWFCGQGVPTPDEVGLVEAEREALCRAAWLQPPEVVNPDARRDLFAAVERILAARAEGADA